MRPIHGRARRPRATRWAAAVALSLALALPEAPAAATAGHGTEPTAGHADSGGPEHPAGGSSRATGLKAPTRQTGGPAKPSRRAAASPETSARAAASARARRTGKPVPIPSLTTETDTVVAKPDGSYALTRATGPVRVRRNGAWVPLDATLVRTADGGWRPRAALSQLRLSGGGRSPMARMTDRRGRRLDLGWPTALPSPAVSGATATYRNVLPDVDLAVTATEDGGFTQVLVVKTARAAKNPAVASYRLTVGTRGVRVRRHADGALSATDTTGKEVFTAPAATMWDSSRPAGTRAAGAVKGPRDTAAARRDAPPPGAVKTVSDTQGPGDGARTARVTAAPSATDLRVTADTRLLTGPDTVYPVYIDPAWKPVWKGTQHWTWVQEGCPSVANFDDYADKYDMGVGNQRWATTCKGREHTFAQVESFNPAGKVINYATFNAVQSYAADNTCANTHAVDLYWTGAINGGTTWSNQPPNLRYMGRASSNSAGGAGCTGGTNQIGWDVTQLVRDEGWRSDLTFGLYGADETSATSNGFKRYTRKTSPYPHSLPFLYVEYDTAPDAPGNPYVSPAPANPTRGDCGWIGRTNEATGGIGLHATVTDPDGDSLDADFNLWDMTAGGTKREWGWIPGSKVPNGGQIDAMAGSLVDGHSYDWYVRGGDGLTSGPWSRGCSFSVDLTPPAAPSVTSTAFPPTGSPATPTGTAGQQGAFTLSATDADNGSGLLRFEWALNNVLPATGAQTVAADGAGRASLSLPVTAWGTNVLHVRAVDRAGNRSPEFSYTFYAPDDPAAKTVLGDITKDGYVDLLVPDGAGDLRLYSKNRDPAAGGELAATAADAPGGSWTGVDTSHRGGNGSYADDLWVHKPGDGKLYYYLNTANAAGPAANDNQYFTVAGAQRLSTTRPTTGCVNPFNTVDQSCGSEYAADWSRVRQVLAIGDVDGTQAPSTPRYDLITVEDDGTGQDANLWLFKGANGTNALSAPRLIGKGGWSEQDLAAPGDTGSSAGPKDGLPDLWARDRGDGRLYQYPSERDGDGKPVFTAYGDRAPGAIQTELTDARHHRVSSDGDGDGDGYADLWSLGFDGRITTWEGRAAGADGVRFGSAQVLRDSSTVDWNTCRTFTHAETGSHQVCGPILAKYLTIGGTDFGYPVGDTTPTPSLYGRYVHFKVAGADNYRSIYWSPDTGAHAVVGAIRGKWADMGWENGYLGFPVSDEYGQTNGARSDFQGGYIRWSSTDYAIADHAYGTGDSTARVTLGGDFNGDGRADLATFVDYGSCGAAWWTHLGSSTSGLGSPFESARLQQGWWCVTRAKYAAGDFNGDGRTDVAALYVYGDQSVKVMEWLARPDGGFTAGPDGWSQAANWDWGRTTLMAGDTDGDGRAELIGIYGFGDGRMANYTWKYRDGTGFDAPVKGFEETHPGWWWYENAKYTAGDVNGDGRTDIIALYVYGDNAVRVFTGLARPDGTHPGFNQSGWSAGAGSWQLDPVKLTSGDTDGDGRADLTAQYRYANGRMGVFQFPADANGNLGTPEMTVDTGYGAWDVNAATPVSGDVDGDGKADMSTVYDYGNGSYATFTFYAGATGKYSWTNVLKSWTAPAGTW
ncbi:FG-GAP-like repeat-containing protein [Streptomyces sp. NPDC093225]|uniref:FG-GAP-like repeat-containing protein n=1 Tax=Streptomyces sp. NPDC093225 TaxID=3366034 RepID=UPI003817D09B